MATQKALITDKASFIHAGAGANQIAPLLFHNGEDTPTSQPAGDVNPGVITKPQYVGSPTFVDGVRGKAIQFNGNSAWKWGNWYFPAAQKYMVSFFFKPTAADVAGAWKMLFTNRGDGWPNYGFHIALQTAGYLNVRVYGNGTTTDLSTSGATTGPSAGIPKFQFVADQIYHVCVIYDTTKPAGAYKLEVYVNDSRVIYSGDSHTFSPKEQSFVLGDMLTSAGALSVEGYALNGWMDEFIFAINDQVWTPAQAAQYRADILAKKWLDYSRTPGSLELPLPTDNLTREWYSGVIDLGGGFTDYGKAQIVGSLPDETFINVWTASSSDGVNFDAWTALGQDGSIYSVNRRYIKLRVEMGTRFIGAAPRLDEIQILDFAKPARINLTTEPLKLYRDLASGLESMGILQNDYDTLIEEQVNGDETLTFKLPLNDPKRKELGAEAVELVAEIGRRRFTIKESKDKRDDSGKAYTEFKGEALWYELGDLKVPAIDLTETTPYEAMSFALENCIPSTDWRLDRVEINDKRRTIRGNWTSVLAIFRDVQGTFGGELVFNTYDKTISLIQKQGQDNGVRFYYGKNLKNVERTVDTFSLVTRLYPIGKGDLTIKTVNPSGEDYVEDTQWVDALSLRNRIRADVWKDDRYVIPQNLYEDAVSLLTEAAKPAVNYTLNVQDLSRLSGHEHESFELGDTVYSVDREILNLELESRIMRRKYNVREPWKTQVELEQPKKQLAEAKVRAFDDSLTELTETNPLDTDDVKQMTVFNHLLNSRADEGLADWVADSSDITTERTGFSGENSFKFTAAYGQKKTLSQKIWGVSHRTAYTVSAQVAFDGEITRGGTLPDPFVGIYVVITYEDGTVEKKPLNVKDVTSGTPTE